MKMSLNKVLAKLKIATLLATLAVIASCGSAENNTQPNIPTGNTGGGAVPTPSTPTVVIPEDTTLVGYAGTDFGSPGFLKLVNMRYTISGDSTNYHTDMNGEFTCERNKQITFYVSAKEVLTTDCANQIDFASHLSLSENLRLAQVVLTCGNVVDYINDRDSSTTGIAYNFQGCHLLSTFPLMDEDEVENFETETVNLNVGALATEKSAKILMWRARVTTATTTANYLPEGFALYIDPVEDRKVENGFTKDRYFWI